MLWITWVLCKLLEPVHCTSDKYPPRGPPVLCLFSHGTQLFWECFERTKMAVLWSAFCQIPRTGGSLTLILSTTHNLRLFCFVKYLEPGVLSFWSCQILRTCGYLVSDFSNTRSGSSLILKSQVTGTRGYVFAFSNTGNRRLLKYPRTAPTVHWTS
jgi:hypothetical protein